MIRSPGWNALKKILFWRVPHFGENSHLPMARVFMLNNVLKNI